MAYFFFSSRRRHTRFKCDWSSDVCSSDLPAPGGDGYETQAAYFVEGVRAGRMPEQRSEERRVGKSVDLGGRRIIKKKKKTSESCASSMENDRHQKGRVGIY